VHQVGFIACIYRDARSTKHKKTWSFICFMNRHYCAECSVFTVVWLRCPVADLPSLRSGWIDLHSLWNLTSWNISSAYLRFFRVGNLSSVFHTYVTSSTADVMYNLNNSNHRLNKITLSVSVITYSMEHSPS
jgi:hypothetical protein